MVNVPACVSNVVGTSHGVWCNVTDVGRLGREQDRRGAYIMVCSIPTYLVCLLATKN